MRVIGEKTHGRNESFVGDEGRVFPVESDLAHGPMADRAHKKYVLLRGPASRLWIELIGGKGDPRGMYDRVGKDCG